jgi:Protein kinase domain
MAVLPLADDDPAEVGGYRLRGRLGAGGMGVVYLAYTPGGRPVALKVVRPELGDDPDFRARFRHEVAAARRVHGLYTAQLLDADADASRPWLVGAYVAGPSLAQAVAAHGPLPAESVLLLMAGVAEALAAIHAAGLVHRDLKPSNVLLAADGPRVIDFGIARAVEATALTRTGVRVGTPQYMSPEQVRGDAVSAAADVWALGALAAFAATGRLPFGQGSEPAVLYRVLHEEPDLAGCPDAVRAVIGPCLTRDPAARPSPAQLIESCRAGAAVKTLEVTGEWLPPALAADLAGHAAPAAPTATAAGGGGAAGPAPELPPVAGRSRRLGRRLSRTAVIAGVAFLVVLALGGYGLTLLPGSGGNGKHPSASGRTGHARGTGSGSSTADSTLGHGGPSPTPTLDPCLVGTWNATLQQITNTINDNATVFTGTGDTGLTMVIQPNGDVTETWYDSTLTATANNGTPWEEIINGTATFRIEGQGDTLSRVPGSTSVSGTVKLLANGSLNKTAPLTLAQPVPGHPGSYTCSGNVYQRFGPSGTTEFERAGG